MDVLISSPILQPDDMAMGGVPGEEGGAPNVGGDPMASLGFDPNMDPELAMAIRLSMQDANAANNNADPQPSEPVPSSSNPGVQPGLQAGADEDEGMYDDDPADDNEKALREALALSMDPNANAAAQAKEEPDVKKVEAKKEPEAQE
mmetsp:Transcript_3333/g.5531  ORF Transcript_3333/g.5531 Transcript_3333/m.5531 type:complete len:147 (-) Transcript_3333:230-670(-)